MVSKRATSTKKINVLVVENDPITRDSHRMNLVSWGYNPILAEGIGVDLIRDACRKARYYECYVALVDMHLFDDHDRQDKSGLDLVPRLKPALSIIVSGSGDNRETTLEATKKGAYNFVGKEETLALDKIRDSIDLALHEMKVGDYGSKVTIAQPLLDKIVEIISPRSEQIRNLLRLLFPSSREIHVESLGGATRTLSLKPRRRSMILKARPDRDPFQVVKIARPAKVRMESANYQKYVKSKIPDNFHAQIQESKSSWEAGGIVYNFFGAGLQTFVEFSSFYKTVSEQEICEVLDHLFRHTWGTRYQDTRRRSRQRSLFQAYSKVWGGMQWQNSLKQYMKENPDMNFDPGIGFLFEDPVYWVVRRTGMGQTPETDASYSLHDEEAVTHGDLQGDNFFVDTKNQAWTIDYERTGYGPILQDFVQLEIDILIRLANFYQIELYQFLQLLLMLFSNQCLSTHGEFNNGLFNNESMENEKIRKTLVVLMKLRTLAQPFLKNNDMRPYCWGLLLNSVFRTTLLTKKIASTESQNEFKHLMYEKSLSMLLGAVISNRLDFWDDPWPLSDWPTEQWKAAQNSTIQLPATQELEKIIRKSSCFYDVFTWIDRLIKIALPICRIEVPTHQGIVFGTGFLVGSNILMTNYHVIETVIHNSALENPDPRLTHQNVNIRFGYRFTNDRNLDRGAIYKLSHPDWLIDFSPYLRAGSTSQDHLDYALLRIEGTPGFDLDSIVRQKRGWITIPKEPYHFIPDSPLCIVQHPEGKPLKLAIESNAIVAVDSSGTRIKYQTNTLAGSSGSPCFSANLDLVALHHSSDPSEPEPKFNAGTPIHIILNRLKQRGLDNLLEPFTS
jgi:ActR/RegA family two-component response regulator